MMKSGGFAMEKRFENGTVYITLCPKLDYDSAMKADEEVFTYMKELEEAQGDGIIKAIVLNAEELLYTSSAGIRLLLKLKKKEWIPSENCNLHLRCTLAQRAW